MASRLSERMTYTDYKTEGKGAKSSQLESLWFRETLASKPVSLRPKSHPFCVPPNMKFRDTSGLGLFFPFHYGYTKSGQRPLALSGLARQSTYCYSWHTWFLWLETQFLKPPSSFSQHTWPGRGYPSDSDSEDVPDSQSGRLDLPAEEEGFGMNYLRPLLKDLYISAKPYKSLFPSSVNPAATMELARCQQPATSLVKAKGSGLFMKKAPAAAKAPQQQHRPTIVPCLRRFLCS